MKKLLLASLGAAFGIFLCSSTYAGPTIGGSTQTTERWKFHPAMHGGYNVLLEGFDGYDDLGNFGFDLYADPPEAKKFGSGATENLLMRISSDWFPLQVPEGVNGLKEDIYALNADCLYRINVNRDRMLSSWNPFLGFGIGLYQDRISLDTPATGKVTGTENYFGVNLSAGVLPPVFSESLPFRLIPEIRYHRIKFESAFVTSMVYQVGIAYWPGKKQ